MDFTHNGDDVVLNPLHEGSSLPFHSSNNIEETMLAATNEVGSPCLPSTNTTEEMVIELGNDLRSSCNPTPNHTDNKVETPYIGMIFESMDAAKEFYIEYGKRLGFPTRCQSTQKRNPRDEKVSSCLMVCAREGQHTQKLIEQDANSKQPIIRRNTPTQKCGCKANMRVLRRGDDKWTVSAFKKEHNHPFISPAKWIKMKVNRYFPEAAKNLTETFDEESLPVGKVASMLDGDLVGFDERDCWNHLNATRNYKKTKHGDASASLTYFQKKSVEDPQFYYNIQTDDEGRAVNFFWVDGQSRLQYSHFGDVVFFDTMYKNNAYEMPFGPFIGVNHHLQSIQFDCALLLEESEESFVWLFETWLGAMDHPPTSILTDQDKAMKAAIAKVFPHMQHRFCLWHIQKKFPSKLAHVYHEKSEFKKDMNRCLWWSFREEDFERRWNEMLVKNNLVEHKWLKKMYDLRKMWVLVYHLKTFYAGMNTTGRSKGMNSFYKDYFSIHTTLKEFVYKNEKCLEKISRRERDEDYVSEHKERITNGGPYLQRHGAKLYTRNVYDKFLAQLNKAQADLKIHKEERDNDTGCYYVTSRRIGDFVQWKVCLNLITFSGWCECKYFEFMGLPCGHILKVHIRHDIDEIPYNFILRRWMKGANQYRINDTSGLLKGAKDSRLLRLFHGSQLATQVVYDGAEDNETYKMVVETLTDLAERIAKHQASHKSHVISVSSDEAIEDPPVLASEQLLLNPNIAQSKGRPKASDCARQKSFLETGVIKKGRECRICDGVGHDYRNCDYNPSSKQNFSKLQSDPSFKDILDKRINDLNNNKNSAKKRKR